MSWLRNLQGQLTELANEVLSEATEEIADPESELQVAAKACTEAERQLASEKSKVELLEKKCSALEQNILDMRTEMDIGRGRLEAMVESRDQELKRLRIELEQSRQSDWGNNWDTVSGDDATKEKAVNVLNNVEKQVEAIRMQKDEEIAILMDQHNQMINDLRESYEDRIRSLECSFAPSTSHSGISVIDHEQHDLQAAKEQLENLSLVRAAEESKEELERLQKTVEELTADNKALSTKVDQLSGQLTGYDSIRRQTAELTRAYNDLNTEYEDYKKNNGGVVLRNQDLVQRIDTLRANLIEYEERYESCKREHAETERQLEQLTQDFSRLRDAMDRTSVEQEMNTMKNALEAARHEARAMKNEVEKFKDTVAMFEEELDQLRDLNKRLVEDNGKLSDSLRQFHGGSIEEKYEAIIANMKEESSALKSKNDVLEEQLELLKKMNSLSQEGEDGEKERVTLLEEKIKLLEQVRDTLKEKLEKTQDDAATLDSLTNQLREALAANSEKTDECEKLRAEVEEHQKEIQARQCCVDDLIVQNNLLQVQYQQAAETIQETKAALAEKDKAILKVEQDLVHVSEDHEHLSAEIERLKNKLSECTIAENSVDEIHQVEKKLQSAVAQYKEQVKCLQEELESVSQQNQRLQNELKERKDLPDVSEHVATLEQQNEELRKVATDKYNESMSYYNELQSMAAKLGQLEQVASASAAKNQHLEEVLEKEKREKTAAQRELTGLRNHLLHMEQTTTAEAVDAEKREMDLRAMISDLQRSNHSASEGATETTRLLEEKVVKLTSELDELHSAAEQWRSQFLSSDKIRQEVTEALHSLQGVLREISTDHEKESATWQHTNGQLQADVSRLVKEVSDLHSEVERLKFDKQAAEDEVEATQRQIFSRQRIIEDLEVQIEDLKSSTRQDSNNYRIDDTTLRSLFLSFFTCSADKKADIALLLANILQFPKDDVDKITSSVFPNGKGVKSRGAGTLSLTEQFVRFLENESESSKTAPQLPVDRASSALSQELPASVRVPPSSLDEILH